MKKLKYLTIMLLVLMALPMVVATPHFYTLRERHTNHS